MVPFSPKLLNEGEEIVLDLHPHWEFFLRQVLVLVAALVVATLVLGWLDNDWVSFGAGALVLIALAWCGLTYLRWTTTNFVVTTDRLIYRHGVLAKHGTEIPLDRVNTVFFHQSIFERMVGSGDLVIESAGEMGRQDFSNVRKPSAIQNEIYKQMEANENRKFDRINPGAAPAPAASIPAQIAQLDALRQQGALSQAEFDLKKQELLGRM